MNKMLVAVFDTEAGANAGLQALRTLHGKGDITLYASGVVAKDIDGLVSVRKTMDTGAMGTATGLAVGSLIGLFVGPVGVAVGAMAGTIAGAARDVWVSGVGVDFIEDTERHLQPGKVALVAEIEEEWVIPVDTAIEAAGGRVFRRGRAEVVESQLDQDIAAFKTELHELEAEASNAGGEARTRLQGKIDAAKAGLDSAMQRARSRVDALKLEADAKAESLKAQLNQASGDVKARIEDRVRRVKGSYHTRGAKLSQAWDLTKEALAI